MQDNDTFHGAPGRLQSRIVQPHLHGDFGMFIAENCVPISTDTTLVRVKWRGAPDLSELIGEPVRLRFHLRNGSLYSFWVSPDTSGASYGYVGAGGPGFTSSGVASDCATRTISVPPYPSHPLSTLSEG